MNEHESYLDILDSLAELEYLRRKRNCREVQGLMKKIKRDLNSIYGAPSAYHDSRQKALPSLQIKSVIFINPATIIFWSDGTKTVVRAQDEPFDKEKGLAMAIVKKIYGNTGSYFDVIKEWVNHGKVLDNPMPKGTPI